MSDNIIRVSADSWLEEIESTRPASNSREYKFTKEMDEDLLLMRNPGNGKRPIYWADVIRLWKKKYGSGSADVLRTRLRYLMGEKK